MADLEALAGRVRDLLAEEPGLTEQRMFGGLAFLLDGHMAVAASGQDGLMVRVDPATTDHLVATTAAVPMEMRGRAMRGWVHVGEDALRTRRELGRWVAIGVRSARSLPPKEATAPRPRRQRPAR